MLVVEISTLLNTQKALKCFENVTETRKLTISVTKYDVLTLLYQCQSARYKLPYFYFGTRSKTNHVFPHHKFSVLVLIIIMF